MKVRAGCLLDLFRTYKDSKGKQAKLKTPEQLQELLDRARTLLRVRERHGGEGREVVVGGALPPPPPHTHTPLYCLLNTAPLPPLCPSPQQTLHPDP